MKVKADSSNLKSFSYDKDKRMLTIEFWSGSTYSYSDVPENIFNELRVADSQGSYFHKNISRKFKYNKLRKDNV